MRKLVTLLLGVSAALALSASANAQMIDKAGKCHAADGKLAKMEVCKPPAAKSGGPCKDPKTGKFIACAAVEKKGPCKDPKTGQFISCKATPATPATPAKPAVATMSKATPAKPAAPAKPAKK